MRENGAEPHDSGYVDTFTQLTEQLRESGDAGLNSFEDNLREIQEYLTKKYLVDKESLDNQELVDIEDDFEEDWNHAGAIARISGRVYLTDYDEEDNVPEEWGESLFDEDREVYFLVEGVPVRSVGAEVFPSFTAEGELKRMSVGYTFAFVDDRDENPVICAYLGDLYQHTYEKPSPQEAIAQLERDWPQEFQFINEWVHADGKMPLPVRLEYITRELQEELASSDSFRLLVETYIQAFVAFDESLPYSISLSHSFETYDGENPYLENDEGGWAKCDVKGQLTILGYRPRIVLDKRSNGAIQSKLFVATYNVEDGDEAEYIRLDAGNITSFMSTRALNSLASRAMLSGVREAASEVLANDITEIDVIDSRDGVAIDYAEQEVDERSFVPARIERLVELETAIKDAIKLIKEQRSILYGTSEEALEATRNLAQDNLLPLFEYFGSMPDVHYHISGEGVLVPQASTRFVDGSEDDEAPIHFAYEVDRQQYTSPLQPGDSYTGPIVAFVSAIGELAADDDEVRGYNVKPALLVGVGKDKYIPIAISNTPLVDITVDKRVLVPLDGTADLKIEELERYREVQEVIELLDFKFEESSILELAQSLQVALIDGVRNDMYVEFDQPELFEEAADEMVVLEREALTHNKVVELFEKVLVGQRVRLKGEIYVRGEQGGYEPYGVEESVVADGSILDLRTDIDGNDLFLAVGGQAGLPVYVRFRSIEQFSF